MQLQFGMKKGGLQGVQPEIAAYNSVMVFRRTPVDSHDSSSLRQSVVDAGGSIALAPFELRPGRFISQIADPDGNMIELGQG